MMYKSQFKKIVWWMWPIWHWPIEWFYGLGLHVRMISEGSCDTEDWSNDAENSALITGIN